VGPTLWGWSRVWDRNNEDGWDGDKFLSPCSSLIHVQCVQEIETAIDIDISMDAHVKSVDMDMYINAKFHIHGKPD